MQECPICFEIRKLHRWNHPDCMDRFCSNCMDRLEDNDEPCPICRRPYLDLQELFDEGRLVQPKPSACARIEEVILKFFTIFHAALNFMLLMFFLFLKFMFAIHFVCKSHLIPDVLNWNRIFTINMTLIKLSLNATGSIGICALIQ